MRTNASRAAVVGCGRLGSYPAGRLDRGGRAVAVVDRDAAALSYLPQQPALALVCRIVRRPVA